MEEFWNTSFGNRTALQLPDEQTYSYAQLFQKADDFAAQLNKERSLIFILVSNCPQAVAAYLGVLRNGHVALLISKDIAPAMLQSLQETYKPDYIYAPDAEGHYRLETTGTGCDSPLHPELALLLSTSGSTGSPKLVRLTRRNLQSNAAAIAEYLELTAEERPVSNLPFYYSYGLSILNSHFLLGAQILLTADSLISPAFWDFCKRCQASSLAGVPYTYDMLEALQFRKKAWPELRYMTQAGGHMSAEMVQRYADWAAESGRKFYVMYGQTEATARMSYLPASLACAHADSIGVAIPGGRFELRDADDKEILRPGEAGELVYHGENVCMGYAQTRKDLERGDDNCGCLHTGDMAKFDERGLYYITGRLKRFLKIAGNRFGLDELEERFREIGIHAVCGGVDNKLMVALTDAKQKAAAAAFLKDTWHLLKTQYKILVVESIPRSSTGKILYAELFG